MLKRCVEYATELLAKSYPPLQMWTEVPKGKNKKPVNKDRFISKMFLRYVPGNA
jgi:hypothetical protein